MPFVVLAGATSCRAEWLTRKAAGENVDRGDLRPIDLGDVAVVRNVRPVVVEDAGRRPVELDVPQNFRVEHGRDGDIKTAVQ